MATTIQVSPADISLLHVAATQWGDATAWLALVTANPGVFVDNNGMTDPFIVTMLTITVPDYDPSMSGSVPGQ